ncbi:dephospho-CoA kinase [Pararhizobium sp.]|uniref:dephospho-CoA kinase n=1 Tax=Pararhizobium sp. TaxID=1977563 RepID=UPI0027238734|nr:dephospho-CoA kinase [Pararhizobium sp.]MDO9416801.1 dephospho-CoA kinase [Pararhizobium sp.]
MIVVGLTGSIGTGKSTTAAMFRELGIPVNDADQVVHMLYENEAVPAIEAAFPGSIRNGVVDRAELSRQLAVDPARFKELEAIVHPLVRQKEIEFLDTHRAAGARMVVLDVPLLFETAGLDRVDAVVVVTCDPAIQRQRVMARPKMTEEKFNLLLSRQMPDAEKRRRADYVIDTGHGFDSAREQVRSVIGKLKSHGATGRPDHA